MLRNKAERMDLFVFCFASFFPSRKIIFKLANLEQTSLGGN